MRAITDVTAGGVYQLPKNTALLRNFDMPINYCSFKREEFVS